MSFAVAVSHPERRAARERAVTGTSLVDDVIRDRVGLEALADQWAGLEARSDGLTLFQGLGWGRAVFDFEDERNNKDFDPVIVTLTDGQRLVALLPLERITEKGQTALVPLGHAFGQYADALIAPELDPREAMRRMIRAALIAAPADTMRFLKVRDGSALMRGLPQKVVSTGYEEGAPYVDLGAYDDFESYFRTIKSKTRKNMRNARNRLEREGTLTHMVAQTPAERLAVIERTLAGRAERLKEQGLSSRAFRDAGFSGFCRSLAARDDIGIAAFSFVHDGRPIAEQWGFVHGGRYYAFIASRDFSNSDESPGKLHLGEILRAVAAEGATGCDLGVPVMPYKMTWATKAVPVRDYALPVNVKGLAIVWIWDVLTRPMLKKLVLAMPRRLRTALMKLVGLGG